MRAVLVAALFALSLVACGKREEGPLSCVENLTIVAVSTERGQTTVEHEKDGHKYRYIESGVLGQVGEVFGICKKEW